MLSAAFALIGASIASDNIDSKKKHATEEYQKQVDEAMSQSALEYQHLKTDETIDNAVRGFYAAKAALDVIPNFTINNVEHDYTGEDFVLEQFRLFLYLESAINHTKDAKKHANELILSDEKDYLTYINDAKSFLKEIYLWTNKVEITKASEELIKKVTKDSYESGRKGTRESDKNYNNVLHELNKDELEFEQRNGLITPHVESKKYKQLGTSHTINKKPEKNTGQSACPSRVCWSSVLLSISSSSRSTKPCPTQCH